MSRLIGLPRGDIRLHFSKDCLDAICANLQGAGFYGVIWSWLEREAVKSKRDLLRDPPHYGQVLLRVRNRSREVKETIVNVTPEMIFGKDRRVLPTLR